MSLTPKQEKFAHCIADGMTQADAYRTAFDAGNMKQTSIHVNASKLMNVAKVAQRVKELKGRLEKKALWTREDSVRVLREVADSEKGSERVQAIKELNAMHGFNAPQKMELTGANGEPLKVESIRRVIVDPKNAS